MQSSESQQFPPLGPRDVALLVPRIAGFVVREAARSGAGRIASRLLRKLVTPPLFLLFMLSRLVVRLLGLAKPPPRSSEAEHRARTEELARSIGARSTMLNLPDAKTRLHVVLAGPDDVAAPLVVLLHGFPESWLTWRYQIPFLAKLGYRVAAPDMPGYNLSDKAPNWKSYRMSGIADTMHSMLVELQRGAKERAAECIVGHDWGGVIAWEWAQAYARDAKKLIVMNAPLTAVYEDRVFRQGDLIQLLSSHYMFFFLTPRLPELCMTSDAARIAASVARAVHSKGDEEFRAFQETLGEYTAAGWVQPLAMRSMINYYRCLLLTLADRVPREQRRIEVPTLLLWGERDTALDLGLAQLPKALVAQGVVHVVPGATHFVQRDAYEEVNERMAKFLKDAK